MKIGTDARTPFFFLWHWIFTGFLLGTLTLMGPVRWSTDRMRAAGWSGSAEKAVVLLFIALLAAVSALLALRLTRKTLEAQGRAGRLGLPGLSLAMFLAALWAWMTPGLMTGASARTAEESYSWSEFVFGPYPEKKRLLELKEEGYTAVISLLSKAVLPFEPVLLAREKEAAAEAGIELIHIPMLPWVSENDHVTEELRTLERRGPGKYYVHCYLGKDRVSVFKNRLSSVMGGARTTSLDPAAIRRISDRDSFERGKITPLGKEVHFTPYPTDEEILRLHTQRHGEVGGLAAGPGQSRRPPLDREGKSDSGKIRPEMGELPLEKAGRDGEEGSPAGDQGHGKAAGHTRLPLSHAGKHGFREGLQRGLRDGTSRTAAPAWAGRRYSPRPRP
ncbi:MAG TPA: hypothetical protein PK523_07345 [Elusimicrobiales bacterium]|nr:hypothetical protein [Elusimicrobiales bacterium]